MKRITETFAAVHVSVAPSVDCALTDSKEFLRSPHPPPASCRPQSQLISGQRISGLKLTRGPQAGI